MRSLFSSPGIILTPTGQVAALEALRNHWYEGTEDSTARTLIWSPVQDVNRDLDRYTRVELSRKARHLYKNSPLIRGLVERLVTLTVGSGFHPVFKSSDAKWNEKAKRWWKRRGRNIHLGPKCSALAYQRCTARARFVDGDCFTVKTEDTTVNYEALVQGVEAQRIIGVNSKVPKDLGVVDGFVLNGEGIVTGMKVRGVDSTIPAAAFVQHMTPTRLGQYRGETILSSAINTARDVEDILAFEKDAVKDASTKQDVIKTSTGTLSAEQFRSMRYGTQDMFGLQTPTPPRTGADLDRSNYYRMRFGGSPVVLQTGDEYTPYEPKRPGSAWQGFMDFLSATICLSTGMPPSVLLYIIMGGTDVRKDLDLAQRVVDPWQMDMALEHDDILDYLMLMEITDGELRGAPADWNVRDWFFPAKLNVDRGQMESDIKQVQAALMSREEFHARWGDSAPDVDTTIIAEAKKRRDDVKLAQFKDVEDFLKWVSLNPQLFVSQKPEVKPGDKKPANKGETDV